MRTLLTYELLQAAGQSWQSSHCISVAGKTFPLMLRMAGTMKGMTSPFLPGHLQLTICGNNVLSHEGFQPLQQRLDSGAWVKTCSMLSARPAR